MSTSSSGPPLRPGEEGQGRGPQEVPRPANPGRRAAITLLAAFPWAFILGQFLLILPRYDRLFREAHFKVDSFTEFLLRISHWVRTHTAIAFLVTLALMGGSVAIAHAVQVGRFTGIRRVAVLFVLFAIPCGVFVLIWVGVMGTHRTLVEGWNH